MTEILLFNLVFHGGVTPVSVSILKSLLRVIGAILLKSQVSPIVIERECGQTWTKVRVKYYNY